MAASLTTRAREWSDAMPKEPPAWIDRGDGFYVEFKKGEKPPLQYVDNIASPGNGVTVDQYICTKTDQSVAIKFMTTSSRRTTIDRLNKEVEILRLLSHYHCIRALGSFTAGDRLGIITQPVATCDLRDYLFEDESEKTKKMLEEYDPPSTFLPRLMGCLAHGLQYIHQPRGEVSSSGAQVRHRDIKPSNILLNGRRVLFADFGLSKVYSDTQTGTSGSSPKTKLYASPERVGNKHRNTSCDVFSLGCVFADMFTVIKGGSAEKFAEYRRKNDPDGKGYFYNTVPHVLTWLDSLAHERCDVQIARLIRNMLKMEPKDRPTSAEVWKTLTTCTSDSGTSESGSYFCGPCCMPLHRDDPLLHMDLDADPSQTKYYLYNGTGQIPKDIGFRESYQAGQGPGLEWIRNLRHWDGATLDVVRGDSPPLYARKRIFLPGNDQGSDRANNEAEILRKMEHRHIITLRSTYRHPNVVTLHFKPAAHCDLRSYLDLFELKFMRSRKLAMDEQLQKDFRFLTESFGCLSSALSAIHAAGYDHGEIRPENILVDNNRIFISKFSFGLKYDSYGKSTKGNANDKFYHRFFNAFGALDLGSRGNQSSKNQSPPVISPEVALYKPPEWNTELSDVGQPAADVFSLGCVFLEIYRALTGGRVRDFEEKRATGRSHAYRDTLPASLELMSSFEEYDYKTKDKFLAILGGMIERDPQKRPMAEEVHRAMVDCKTREGFQRCGVSCTSRR